MKTKITANKLSVFALAMLITGAIDSIRNLPTIALFGSELIVFSILAAIVFLIPVGLISAELSSTWSTEPGIYGWVKKAFGEKWAFVAVWLQWINTMVWYPTILSFIAGTAAYLVNPNLAHHRWYLISVILIVFWGQTLLNLKGLNVSAKFASFCAVVGMIIPMVLIIVLAIIWLVSGEPLQIHLTSQTMMPNLSHPQSWIALTAMITSFLGLELSSVHVNDIDQPKKKFPKALMISVAIVLSTMIAGSLAIAYVLPKNQINLVAGIMQAFTNFFAAYHLGWMLPIITIMILIGSVGGMTNWIISPAKGLLQSAESGYLPKYFTKVNKHHVAGRLLITQAILVTFVCLAFLLMPSVNGSYWLLTDLSTQLYVVMYVFMFLAAIVLRYKFPNQLRTFHLGKKGLWVAVLLGLIGCITTLIVGFLPPGSINVGGAIHYEVLFGGGLVVMLLPAILLPAILRSSGK